MPGSPPINTTAPSTNPPPSTRSNSPIPVEARTISDCRTSTSGVILAVSIFPAQLPRREGALVAAGSREISDNVFHAPQASHWPCHFGYSAPQLLQT